MTIKLNPPVITLPANRHYPWLPLSFRPAPWRPFMLSDAEKAGYDAGLAVLAGKLEIEEAGDRWVKWADKSYGSGVAFERGYNRTGATR